jgi:hypothetical protein
LRSFNVYLAVLYYFFESSKIDYKIWGVDTVAAYDFTADSIIAQYIWTNFLDSPEGKSAENKLSAFLKHLERNYAEFFRSKKEAN